METVICAQLISRGDRLFGDGRRELPYIAATGWVGRRVIRFRGVSGTAAAAIPARWTATRCAWWTGRLVLVAVLMHTGHAGTLGSVELVNLHERMGSTG